MDTYTLCLTQLPTDVSAQSGWGEPGVSALPVGLQRIWLRESPQRGPSLLRQCSRSGRVPAQSGSEVALISMAPRGFIARFSLLLSLFVPTNP